MGVPMVGQAAAAGFWRRFGARFIDSLILGIPATILVFVALAIGGTERELCTRDGELAICDVPTGTAWALMGVVWVASIVVSLLYFAKLDGLRGATWGRQAVGIRLADEVTLQPIGQGRTVGRFFMSYVSAIPFALGYLWMLWDPKRQTWHDKVARSVVIQPEAAAAPAMVGAAAPSAPAPGQPPPPPPPPPPAPPG